MPTSHVSQHGRLWRQSSWFSVNVSVWQCQLCRHWWYRWLSLWQPPVPPVTPKLASWQLSFFSVTAHHSMNSTGSIISCQTQRPRFRRRRTSNKWPNTVLNHDEECPCTLFLHTWLYVCRNHRSTGLATQTLSIQSFDDYPWWAQIHDWMINTFDDEFRCFTLKGIARIFPGPGMASRGPDVGNYVVMTVVHTQWSNR